jgi:hypothetical protein
LDEWRLIDAELDVVECCTAPVNSYATTDEL